MAEVKTPPTTTKDDDGNTLYTFGPDHTFADVARWIISEGGADDVAHLLEELKGQDDD